MFSPGGPSLRDLAVQALSSVEHGYDLLAPRFDRTPFRTSDRILDATAAALRPFGPFGDGLDVCCGTGAGLRVLRPLCGGRVAGVDFSAGMLAQARRAHPDAEWIRADARRTVFAAEFDLAVSFGAFGHFLASERPGLFAGVHQALRPGGLFAFPVFAPPRIATRGYWVPAGFDAVMRVRNAVWRPRFVMYYRTFPLRAVRAELSAAGFTVRTAAVPEFGHRPDGAPRCRLVMARKA
ncbi:class I SAM-dependent DNA methyltransferase [Streptomyces sp. NPDC002574]|uniref:class I SAM-dependent DNA methyltransferase n=1 Tax=Streptomyces sp. NPDC002574 TaxID=3364652 RepID=UPI0036B8B0B9